MNSAAERYLIEKCSVYLSWNTIRFEIFLRLTQKYGTRDLPKPRVLQNENKKVRKILLNKTINIVYGESFEYKRIQFPVKYVAKTQETFETHEIDYYILLFSFIICRDVCLCMFFHCSFFQIALLFVGGSVSDTLLGFF